MYKRNDAVIYARRGVCIIEDITLKEFGGTMKQYYVLRPVYQKKSCIFVPVDNDSLSSKMIRLVTPDEIRQYIRRLPTLPAMWDERANIRQDRYREIMEAKNRLQILNMIRSIHMHREKLAEKGKKLYAFDEHALKDAESLIYDEFAYVLNMDREQVSPYIQKELHLI